MAAQHAAGAVPGRGRASRPSPDAVPGRLARDDGSPRLIHALLAAQGGSWVQLATTDVDATSARLRAYGASTIEPAAKRADGLRAGAALDPWDNTLRLVERPAMNPRARRCPTQ